MISGITFIVVNFRYFPDHYVQVKKKFLTLLILQNKEIATMELRLLVHIGIVYETITARLPSILVFAWNKQTPKDGTEIRVDRA
jgi:hypothetical protein